AEADDDVAQVRLLLARQHGSAGDHAVRREVDEPLDLDVQALAVERGLGQEVDERGDGEAVAAVERTEGDRWGRVGEPGAVTGGHGCIFPRAAQSLPGRPWLS